MLFKAHQCFLAQLELANLTRTLPDDVVYNLLVSNVKQKISESPNKPMDIVGQLAQKGIPLPLADEDGTRADAGDGASEAPMVVFLFDIEGTTTPLPFVQEVMMPLAAAHVDDFAAAHFPSDATFVQHVAAAAAASANTAAQSDAPPASNLHQLFQKAEASKFSDANDNAAIRALFCEHFREEMKKGSKEEYMKAVQGAIWEEVFAKGQHQTQVFPDVHTFFRFAGAAAMRERCRIAIYSTGSVAAQKLVMRHTPYGDLNPFISAYFDPTIVGTKLTPKSYSRIRNMLATQLDIAHDDNLRIVFVTDNTSEASAADASGAIESPVLCIRPLNAWITFDTILSVSVPFVTSFVQFMRRDVQVDYEQLVKDTMAALPDKKDA